MSRVRGPRQMSYPSGQKKTLPKERRPKPPSERPLVTDHAVLRYMERVLGLDVEVIRKTMLSAEQRALVLQLKRCELPIGGGFYAVAVDGHVVTIKT